MYANGSFYQGPRDLDHSTVTRLSNGANALSEKFYIRRLFSTQGAAKQIASVISLASQSLRGAICELQNDRAAVASPLQRFQSPTKFRVHFCF
jgi:hypothetical protein